ncbi:26S proteasome non-ATPase regulatory subunit 10-like isoform X4 [Octopus vulgaris]|nr:26S proteasome non-ATPase regulatory subunit 10-like isoform X4 [Octopus vulgaris]
MSVMSSYWKQLQLKQIMDNVMNNVLSINQFWSWSILAIIIVTMILRNKRSKAKKSFYTELTKKKDDFKNPYKLNIYDLCKCACLSGSKKLILYLLLKGADLMSITKDGDGPLYLATYAALNSPETDVTTLDLLITYGCDVNRQNNKGYTPLHRAASKGNYKVVKCLLRHGARINVPNKSGIYPIDCASNAGHPEIAKILAFKVNNPHVWDVVEPHTPPSIKMGLRTPMRPNILQSPTYKRSFISQRMKPM